MEERLSTEQLILQSAEKEFMQKGFSAARTTSIATAAGVTHAMLHYYFRTKEALYAKVIEQKIAFISKKIAEVLNEPSTDIIEKLEKVLEMHFNLLVENPRLPLLLISDVTSDNNALSLGMMKMMYGTVSTLCRKQIEEVVESGRMRQISLENLLVDIVGLNLISVALAGPFAMTMQTGKEEFLRTRLEENRRTLRYRIIP